MDEEREFEDYTWRALVEALEPDEEDWPFVDEDEDEDEDEDDDEAAIASEGPPRPWESLDEDEHIERLGPTLLELLRPHLLELVTTGQLPPHVAEAVRNFGDDKVDPRKLEFFAASRALGDGDLAARLARPLVDRYRGFEHRIIDALGIAMRLNAVELPPLTASVYSRAIQMYLAGFYEGAVTFVVSAMEQALAAAQAGDESLSLSNLLNWASRKDLIDDVQIRSANRLVAARNRIVHEGLDASPEDARSAITLVGGVLTSLHARRYE